MAPSKTSPRRQGNCLSSREVGKDTPCEHPIDPWSWTTATGVIAPTLRKRYQWCHLAQLITACVLVQLDLMRKAVSKRMQSLTPTELVALTATAHPR